MILMNYLFSLNSENENRKRKTLTPLPSTPQFTRARPHHATENDDCKYAILSFVLVVFDPYILVSQHCRRLFLFTNHFSFLYQNSAPFGFYTCFPPCDGDTLFDHRNTNRDDEWLSPKKVPRLLAPPPITRPPITPPTTNLVPAEVIKGIESFPLIVFIFFLFSLFLFYS